MSNEDDERPASVSEGVPIRGMPLLKLVHDDGTSVEISPYGGPRFSVKPLGFAELVQAVTAENPTFCLTINNAAAPSSSTGLASGGPLCVRASITNNGPVLAFGLVEGGWLPLPWAHKRVAWLDRNVVIALEQLTSEARAAAAPGKPASLTKILGLDTEELSPILFVLEGRRKRPPTDFEMRAELGRAMRTLKATLPDAKVQEFGTTERRALRRYLLEHTEGLARGARFLVKAAPLVAQSVRASERVALERQVMDTAASEGVPVKSLPVLALLSCIYDNSPDLPAKVVYRPGRAIVKPKVNFDAEAAYNALADMSFIELMFNARAMTPHVEPVLYTRDIGIAAFWTALQASGHQVTETGRGRVKTSVQFSLGRDMLPALTDGEVVDLCSRLSV